MSRISKNQITLVLLAIVFSVVALFLFNEFFNPRIPPFATAIISAFIGAVLTVMITMVLLTQQSESDMKKERTVKLLEEKMNVYNKLMDEVRSILTKSEIDTNDVIELQLLNQKLVFISGREVLEKFKNFVEAFSKCAKNKVFQPEDQNNLLDLLAELSIEIRLDLASREERVLFLKDKDSLLKQLKANVKELSEATTTNPEDFIEKCDENEKHYFEKLFSYLKENNIKYVPGTKGFSIKNKDGKPIAYFFPSSGGTRQGIQILADNLTEEKKEAAKLALQSKDIDTEKTRYTFKTTKFEVDKLCTLLSELVK